MDGGGEGAGYRQGPTSAGSSSLLLPMHGEVPPWFSTQTLPQARGSVLGGMTVTHPAPGSAPALVLWRSVLVSADNLSGERRSFRAEASLLLECKTFFWRSTGEQVDQLSLHAVTWAASQSSQTLSVHHLQLHVHDR